MIKINKFVGAGAEEIKVIYSHPFSSLSISLVIDAQFSFGLRLDAEPVRKILGEDFRCQSSRFAESDWKSHSLFWPEGTKRNGDLRDIRYNPFSAFLPCEKAPYHH
ncbi:hypothetical protein NPIL_578051 [Nephila pilipes]|uniref:Uncharacterized protein n=1 Tax=Nephila pilipes TaxID=299642 RepID=A0A8X6P8W1_NEPPI|nr:hypothetical protein NPIL_578051 [Nephila pilipes]